MSDEPTQDEIARVEAWQQQQALAAADAAEALASARARARLDAVRDGLASHVVGRTVVAVEVGAPGLWLRLSDGSAVGIDIYDDDFQCLSVALPRQADDDGIGEFWEAGQAAARAERKLWEADNKGPRP